MKIPFADWLPDLPDHDNPGATEALNVIPGATSYKTLYDLSEYSGALSGAALGAIAGLDNDGNANNFAGTAATLERMHTDATWVDKSKAGGYSTSSAERWRFVQWGDQILATNFDDEIQEYDMSSSSLFADLAASAPQARHIARVRDFVVVGNTYDAVDGNVPYRVRWCAIGDPTDWTVSATTQADYQDLNADNGWVQGVVGGDVYGVVFQEKAISRMSYVGSPSIFQIDEVEKGRGCLVPGSIVSVGTKIYFLSENGFYVFNGAESIPIGDFKVDKTFFADFDESNAHTMTSSIDPINKLVIWAYSSIYASPVGTPDRMIMYNWATDRWAHAEISMELIWNSVSLGYTLEDLDGLGTMETLPFSLDSRAWMGGTRSLSAFSTDHKLSYFNGTALAGTIETGESRIYPGRNAFVRRFLAHVEGDYTAQVGTRGKPGDDVTWTSEITPNSEGEIECLSNARYHRVRIKTSGDFGDAQGIELLEHRPTGRRNG